MHTIAFENMLSRQALEAQQQVQHNNRYIDKTISKEWLILKHPTKDSYFFPGCLKWSDPANEGKHKKEELKSGNIVDTSIGELFWELQQEANQLTGAKPFNKPVMHMHIETIIGMD